VSVHSTFFGVTRLTGKDAKEFRREMRYGRPSKEAVASLKRGEALVRVFEKKGYVKIKAA
jgi:hypothetical protein